MALSLHDLPAGVDVYSSDGEKLGSLKHMVLKRSDLTLTHVVVDVGFLRSGHRLWEGGLGWSTTASCRSRRWQRSPTSRWCWA